MGHSKKRCKREVYSNIILPEETRKITNKQSRGQLYAADISHTLRAGPPVSGAPINQAHETDV